MNPVYFPIVICACASFVAPSALAQTTYYSPGGVGIVDDVIRKNVTPDIEKSIFAWDLNADSNTNSSDSYSGETLSGLDITGGEFRVILGSSVNLSDTFWTQNQTWANIISQQGNGVIPTLTTGNVSAYTYSGASDGTGTFTPVNTSGNGQFSLSGNNSSGYSVAWAAVPEPTSAFAGLLLGAGILRRRRR